MGFDHEVSEAEEKLMQDMENKALEEFSKLKKKKGS
jgi:ssRNA-specific RNase YbeY (16S rRNA maturation enzyme)